LLIGRDIGFSGQFLKYTKIVKIFALCTFFHGKGYLLKTTKNWFGFILGEIFHKFIRSPSLLLKDEESEILDFRM
jgi:hypothetical protein